MLEKISEILKSIEVDAWKIEEITVRGEEHFFVGKKLDMSRAKSIRYFNVIVYRDFQDKDKEYRGSSSVRIFSTMEEEELRESLEGAAFAAGFVKNPWYPIADPYTARFKSKALDLSAISSEAIGAVFEADVEKDAWLNSVEIFVTRNDYRIVNSAGLDVSYSSYRTHIETIIAASGNEEVELYDDYKIALPDITVIRDRMKRLIIMARDRARAIHTPALRDFAVVLTGEPVKEVMRYYLNQSSAKMKYDRISQAEAGNSIQGEESGDKVNIELLPELQTSYYSAPVDKDGLPLRDCLIVEEGSLIRFWGDIRFSSYLGIIPTGDVMNFSVRPGSLSLDDLRSEPHIEVSHFSAVDVDETTGDFGGEIRLGWYYDGSKRIPVTGGSITGNLREILSMQLSKEVELDGDYLGPVSVKIDGFSISGE
jgi:PmbA protein